MTLVRSYLGSFTFYFTKELMNFNLLLVYGRQASRGRRGAAVVFVLLYLTRVLGSRNISISGGGKDLAPTP